MALTKKPSARGRSATPSGRQRVLRIRKDEYERQLNSTDVQSRLARVNELRAKLGR